MKPAIFYYATIGTNINVSEDRVMDFTKDFMYCSDPISYGIWWIWNKFNTIPKVTIFCTDGEKGSIINFDKIKNKFQFENLIEHSTIDAKDLHLNIKKLNSYFDNEIERIIRNNTDYFIIVNPTSGTNPMTISLFNSIISKIYKIRDLHRLKIIYVQEFKNIKKNEKGEFEDMSVNELDIANIADMSLLNAAREHITNQNFSSAYLLLEKLKSKDPLLDSFAESFRPLSEGLMRWDQFNHKEAINELKVYLRNIKNVRHLVSTEDERVIQVIEKKVTLNKDDLDKLSIFHVVDLLSNAERKFQKKDNLDAILRLYRSIELFLEFRLLHHNFNVQNPNFDIFPEEGKRHINIVYNQIWSGIVNKYNKNISFEHDLFKNSRVYTKEMLALLEFFNDLQYKKLVELIKIEDILNLMELRNKSYLTHGLQSVLDSDSYVSKGKDILEKFKNLLIENYGSEFFEVSNLNLKFY